MSQNNNSYFDSSIFSMLITAGSVGASETGIVSPAGLSLPDISATDWLFVLLNKIAKWCDNIIPKTIMISLLNLYSLSVFIACANAHISIIRNTKTIKTIGNMMIYDCKRTDDTVLELPSTD